MTGNKKQRHCGGQSTRGTVCLRSDSKEIRSQASDIIRQRGLTVEIGRTENIVQAGAGLAADIVAVSELDEKTVSLASSLAERRSNTPVLVAAQAADDNAAIQLLLGGVDGFICPLKRLSILPHILKRLREGEVWYSRKVLGTLVRNSRLLYRMPEHSSAASIRLTRREGEILTFLALGHSNQNIADELSLSIRTVENHLYRIYNRFRISNRVEAYHLAIQAGLVVAEADSH